MPHLHKSQMNLEKKDGLNLSSLTVISLRNGELLFFNYVHVFMCVSVFVYILWRIHWGLGGLLDPPPLFNIP